MSWFLLCVGQLSLTGLPVAVSKDQIVQINADSLVGHVRYHTPFLLLFYGVVYAPLPQNATAMIIHFRQETGELFCRYAQTALAFCGYTII